MNACSSHVVYYKCCGQSYNRAACPGWTVEKRKDMIQLMARGVEEVVSKEQVPVRNEAALVKYCQLLVSQLATSPQDGR